jgi:DNA-binding response OmpR family regulator
MCHVLIIEDDWLIADHIAHRALAAGAVSIDMAESEEDAVACALAHPPAVIISDVHLGAGTGPGAVARIVATLGELPVIFVTGEPRAFRPAAPAMHVLHKPVDDRTLDATLRAVIP